MFFKQMFPKKTIAPLQVKWMFPNGNNYFNLKMSAPQSEQRCSDLKKTHSSHNIVGPLTIHSLVCEKHYCLLVVYIYIFKPGLKPWLKQNEIAKKMDHHRYTKQQMIHKDMSSENVSDKLESR